MGDEYVCRKHGSVKKGEFCKSCVEELKNAPHPADMTGEERAQEFEFYGGPLTVPFQLLHPRLEGLVGMPIWSHQFGTLWDTLVEQARKEPWKCDVPPAHRYYRPGVPGGNKVDPFAGIPANKEVTGTILP